MTLISKKSKGWKNVDNKPKSLTLICVDLLGDHFEVVRFDGGRQG